jgi:hypothetical protein
MECLRKILYGHYRTWRIAHTPRSSRLQPRKRFVDQHLPNDIIQPALATEIYLEALTFLLSQSRSLEQWITVEERKPLITVTSVQNMIAEHLLILLTEKSELFGKFNNLNGFKLLEDALIHSTSEKIQLVILRILLQASQTDTQYTITLVQSGLTEQILKILKGSKSQDTQLGALNLIISFKLKVTHIEIPTISEEALQAVISSAQMNDKLPSLLYLQLPEAQDCLQKHLEDGKTQAVFKQILPLKCANNNEYLSYTVHLTCRKRYAGYLCELMEMVLLQVVYQVLQYETVYLPYEFPPGIAVKLLDLLNQDTPNSLAELSIGILNHLHLLYR